MAVVPGCLGTISTGYEKTPGAKEAKLGAEATLMNTSTSAARIAATLAQGPVALKNQEGHCSTEGCCMRLNHKKLDHYLQAVKGGTEATQMQAQCHMQRRLKGSQNPTAQCLLRDS